MSNLAILTDKQGNFIGEVDRYSLKSGDMIAIAILWMENNHDEILLAKRSSHKKHDANLWGPAASGTLEPGETFLSNIVKEAEEEIGVTLEDVKEIYRMHYWRKDNGQGRYAVWFRAILDMEASGFKLQASEVDEVRWITKTDLLRELANNPQDFVDAHGAWHKLIGV